jgi:FkbM family methyltransferase
MTDLNALKEAGRSKTSRAWMTNPVRTAILIAGRPFFARLLSDIHALRLDNAQLERRLALAGEEQQKSKVSTGASQGVSEELRHLARMFDALRKDQMACNYRLGSLDDRLEEDQQRLLKAEGAQQRLVEKSDESAAQHEGLLARIESLERTVSGERANAKGIVTLPRNTPMAVFGTSLVLHDGPYGRFVLRQPDLISDYILGGAFWDSHLKKIIEDAAAADRTAIDAGSYLGFHSVYMSRFFRTVYAFEPQVEIYRMLCANLLLNGCHNVMANNCALYDVAGHMRLANSSSQEIAVPERDGEVDYDHIGNAAAMSFQLAQQSDSSAVAAMTIDELHLVDLAFIKVDTQGSDLRVLRGAKETLKRCRPVIAAEYERELSRNHGASLDDFYSFFNELGYDVKVAREQSEGKQLDLLATPR